MLAKRIQRKLSIFWTWIFALAMAKTFLFVFMSLALFLARLSDASPPPALFVLGDSTVDVGTNSYVPGTLTRADFPYYGVDFPNSRPTGRFSNGFTTADFIAKHLGFKRSPQPYLFLATLKNAFQRRMFRGVSFASAGSGILDSTGRTVVPFSQQIKQFATVQRNLTTRLGLASTNGVLSKSVFAISVGSNDLFAYFASNATVPPQEFLTTLMTTYGSHITALYSLGARKFGILSVPPLGCVPSSRLFNATGGCVDAMNAFSSAFHSALQALFQTLASQLPGIKYSIGNSYEMTMGAINDPQWFGFKDVSNACCGTGRLNAETQCNGTANLCLNRHEYLFWDLFHSTQKASRNQAEILFGGGPELVSPINFSQLALD